jgi:hypothetical protein
MSSSSDSSGPSGPSGPPGERRLDLRKLAERVQRKLSAQSTHQPMALADHRKATEAMLKIRDILISGAEEPTREVKMALTCAGIAVQRRVAFADGSDDAEHGALFKTTMALLFALVVMCNADACQPSGSSDTGHSAAEDPGSVVLAWHDESIESAMRAAGGDETNSWLATHRQPGALCKVCIAVASSRSHAADVDELADVGTLFFRQSATALMASLLSSSPTQEPTQPDNFLTLGSLDFVAQANNNLDENLKSIVDGADSEAGQTVCCTHFDLHVATPPPSSPTHAQRRASSFLCRCCAT